MVAWCDYSETVFVFRGFPPGTTAETIKQLGVHTGGAYRRTSSGKFIFVRDVDLSKSDEELAKEFGVK